MLIRAALIAVGSLMMTLWPVMILAGFLRRFVNLCEWRSGSSLFGTPVWRFLPPRMTCEWASHEIPTLNTWAELNGEETLPLIEAGTTYVESFPEAVVAWLLLGFFLAGLGMVLIGRRLQDPSIENL